MSPSSLFAGSSRSGRDYPQFALPWRSATSPAFTLGARLSPPFNAIGVGRRTGMPAGLQWGRPVVFALDLVAGWAVVATNVGRGPALGSVGEGLRCDFPPPRLSPAGLRWIPLRIGLGRFGRAFSRRPKGREAVGCKSVERDLCRPGLVSDTEGSFPLCNCPGLANLPVRQLQVAPGRVAF